MSPPVQCCDVLAYIEEGRLHLEAMGARKREEAMEMGRMRIKVSVREMIHVSVLSSSDTIFSFQLIQDTQEHIPTRVCGRATRLCM